jgi:membrane-associated phospholipid phosphatase
VIVLRQGRASHDRRPASRSKSVLDEHAWQAPWQVWAIGVVALVVSWRFAVDDRPEGIEVAVGQAAVALPEGMGPSLRLAMQTGSQWWWLLLVAVAAGLIRFRLMLALVVAGGTAWILSTVIKHLVTSPRPSVLTLEEAPRAVESGYGFPSTHAAMSTAVMLTVAAAVLSTRAGRSPLGRWVLIGCIAVAGATGLARMYLGVHWLFDVVGGIGLGLLCGAVAIRVGRRRRSTVSDQWV